MVTVYKKRKVVLCSKLYFSGKNYATAYACLEEIPHSGLSQSLWFLVDFKRNKYTGKCTVHIPKRFVKANEKIGFQVSTCDILQEFKKCLEERLSDGQ